MDARRSESTNGLGADLGSDSQGELSDLMSTFEAHLRAIGGHVERIAQVRRDRLAHRLRTMVAYGAIGLLSGLVIVCLGVVGVVFLARGLSASLTVLFEGRVWLGDLVTGVLILGGLSAMAIVGLRLHERRALRRKKAEYAIETSPSTGS